MQYQVWHGKLAFGTTSSRQASNCGLIISLPFGSWNLYCTENIRQSALLNAYEDWQSLLYDIVPLFLAFSCRNLPDLVNRHKFIFYCKPPHLQISFTKLGRVRPIQLWIFHKNESSIFAAWRCFQLSPQSKSLMPISSLFRFTLLYRITMQQEKRGLTRISRPSFTTIRPSCLLVISGVTYSTTIERENPAFVRQMALSASVYYEFEDQKKTHICLRAWIITLLWPENGRESPVHGIRLWHLSIPEVYLRPRWPSLPFQWGSSQRPGRVWLSNERPYSMRNVVIHR